MRHVLIIFLLLELSGCKSSAVKMERIYSLNDLNEDKFYLLNIIRDNQITGKLGDRPMVIIDNTIKFHYCIQNFASLNIKKGDIKRIKISEAAKCMNQYGAAATFGLIEIFTY